MSMNLIFTINNIQKTEEIRLETDKYYFPV